MPIRCIVHVDLRPDILDPQGRAVLAALRSLGYEEVADARVGRVVTLTFSGGNRRELEARVDQMARQLLANAVIENFRVEWPA